MGNRNVSAAVDLLSSRITCMLRGSLGYCVFFSPSVLSYKAVVTADDSADAVLFSNHELDEEAPGSSDSVPDPNLDPAVGLSTMLSTAYHPHFQTEAILFRSLICRPVHVSHVSGGSKGRCLETHHGKRDGRKPRNAPPGSSNGFQASSLFHLEPSYYSLTFFLNTWVICQCFPD